MRWVRSTRPLSGSISSAGVFNVVSIIHEVNGTVDADGNIQGTWKDKYGYSGIISGSKK